MEARPVLARYVRHSQMCPQLDVSDKKNCKICPTELDVSDKNNKTTQDMSRQNDNEAFRIFAKTVHHV